MKMKFCVALAVCVALMLGACGAAAQALIVGRWEVEGAAVKMTAQFDRDGTAAVTIFGQTSRSTYKLISDNELEWTMAGKTTRAKINVTATELELTDDENRTIKYKRL